MLFGTFCEKDDFRMKRKQSDEAKKINVNIKNQKNSLRIENFIPHTSDGYRASPISLFLNLENYLIISELSYAYGIEKRIKIVGGREVEEDIETLKPILLICKYNKQTKEKFYELKLLKSEDKLEIEDLNISLVQNTISKVGIPTLMKYKTLETIYTEIENKNISIKEIYQKLKETYEKYIYHNNPTFYSFLAVYSLTTYFKEIFSAFPVIYFYGTFGCGKTRTLQTLNCFCHRSFLWGFQTEATTFRYVDAIRGTLLIDNQIFRNSKEILNYLLGYKKDSLIPRLYKAKSFKKETYEVEFFNPSTAYVLNSTDSPDKFSSALLEQFLSRCISINLIKGEPVIKEDPKLEQFTSIREDLYRLKFQIFEKVYERQNELIKSINLTGRERELWLPIFTVASLISDEVLKEMKKYQKELNEIVSENLYKREKILIKAIESLDCENDTYKFTTTELHQSIRNMLVANAQDLIVRDEKEKEFIKFWSLRSVGSLLKNLGFKEKSIRENNNISKKYIIYKSELEELKKKYFENVDSVVTVDILSEHIQENQPSKFQENSQKTQDFESENNSICPNNLSTLSTVSTKIDTSQLSKKHKEPISILRFLIEKNGASLEELIENGYDRDLIEKLKKGGSIKFDSETDKYFAV